jgi:hypothetical protein
MARKDIFLKKGFVEVDTAKPDFQLLVYKFHQQSPNPQFKDLKRNLEPYQEGLYILRSAQCPYTEKNVNAMLASAKENLGLNAQLIDLQEVSDVQNSPCAFGSFCVIYDGEVLSHHPISNTRFENIMKKRV